MNNEDYEQRLRDWMATHRTVTDTLYKFEHKNGAILEITPEGIRFAPKPAPEEYHQIQFKPFVGDGTRYFSKEWYIRSGLVPDAKPNYLQITRDIARGS